MLFYIELEHGCAIKSAENINHAWELAYAHANEMEDNVESVCAADDEHIEWIKSMGGHVPGDRY